MANIRRAIVSAAVAEIERRQKLLPKLQELTDGILFEALTAFQFPAVVAEWFLSSYLGWDDRCILELLDDPKHRDHLLQYTRNIEPRRRGFVHIKREDNGLPSLPLSMGDAGGDFLEYTGILIAPPVPGELLRARAQLSDGNWAKHEFVSAEVTQVYVVTRDATYSITRARE